MANRAPRTIGFLLLLLVSAPAAAGSAILPPAECLKRLPPEKSLPADPDDQYNEYTPRNLWKKFRDMICTSGDPTKDGDFQSCIVQKLQSGAVGPRNAYLAYNACIPGVATCKKDAAAAVQKEHASAAAGAFLRNEFCGGNSGYNADELRCMARRGTLAPKLLDDTQLLYSLCVEPARPCVEDLISRFSIGGKNKDIDGLKVAGRLCRAKANDPEEGDCQIDIVAKNWQGSANEHQLGLARFACQSAYQSVRACVVSFGSREDVFKRQPNNGVYDSAAAVCGVPAGRRRDCTEKEYLSGLTAGEAKLVCQFGDQNRQACVRDAIQGVGVYAGPELRKLPEALRNEAFHFESQSMENLPSYAPLSRRLCEYSNAEDRACVVNHTLEGIKANRLPSTAVYLAHESCERSSEEIKDCIAEGHTLPLKEIREILGTVPFDITTICQIPEKDMRACVINGLLSIVMHRTTFTDLMVSCEAGSLDGTLRGLGGNHHRPGCPHG